MDPQIHLCYRIQWRTIPGVLQVKGVFWIPVKPLLAVVCYQERTLLRLVLLM